MPKKAVIGIDLGTTNSCVAVYQNGKVDIISDELGNKITPSSVLFDEKVIHVGTVAKKRRSNKPYNSVFEVKRLIGRRFADPTVHDDMKKWPFTVIDDNGAPKIRVQISNEWKILAPEEISAYILKKLKSCAETFIGTEVDGAVISVPAYFNDSQRQATIDAAGIAGLNVLNIINEPIAAALAFAVDKKTLHDRTVLVFDMGGGTFDVAIASIKDKEITVKAAGGDTHLGGVDFDMRLVDHFNTIAKRKHGKDFSKDPKNACRLKANCEEAKILLSSTQFNTDICIEGILDGEDFVEDLRRSTFEEINTDLFNKAIYHVEAVLKDARMDKSDIDEVILVGGSSRIPKIKKLLSAFFDGEKLNATINPDEAVAYGAAVKAALVSGEHTIDEFTLNDVVPWSLGRDISNGDMVTFIERNSRFPITVVQNNFTTVIDYQTSVTVSVYEGERARAKDNNLLGTFSYDIGERALAGVPKNTYTFTVDENSILHVSGVNEKTNKSGKITIIGNKGRLLKEEIDRLVEQRKKCKIV